ncbi:MAG: M20/M25/M40 family metallo-hydrolase [Acidobacteriia bacterium]|nr:M20/M25/M40 family metallo-hydrolase [Terriglobia bacterium]
MILSCTCVAQTPGAEPSIHERVARLIDPPTGAWNAAQIATMGRLREAALADPYALDMVRHLTDNIGPRIAGSAQAQGAVEFAADQMRAAGADVRLEKVDVPHWVRGVELGELVQWAGQAPGTTQRIVLTALGGSVGTPPDGLTADLLVVNAFADLKQLADGAAKGRIVLFNQPFDKQLAVQGNALAAYERAVLYRSAAPIVAGSLGASAVLIRSVGSADYRLPHTGATYYSPEIPRIPAAAITAEDADLLANLARQGPARIHLTLTPHSLARTESYNVVADWKGSEHPEEIVVVSGHLDSWDLGTGALDDGVGVAVSMQVIHLLQRLAIHPRRTIRFVAWMNEEMGLDGSRAYATAHQPDFANHVAALESDLGSGHPGGITYVGKPELGDWLGPLIPVLEPIGAVMLTPGTEAGADILALTAKGVPGFTPTVDSRRYFDYHHSAADTFDKVVPRELNENAAVAAVLAYALADSVAKPPH